MRYLPSTSKAFQKQQAVSYTVTAWDTPFGTLEGGIASNGLRLDVRQPTTGGTFTLKADLLAASAATASDTFLDGDRSLAAITDGRTANAVGYWAAGAPGHHGVTVSQRVAYRFRGYIRSQAGRAWLDPDATATFRVAVGGNGLVRIVKNGTTQVLWSTGEDANGTVSEAGFLDDGLRYTAAIAMSGTDYLDLYYVQDGEDWGGVVFKAVADTGSEPTEEELRDAPVLGCGLLDASTTAPTARTLRHVESVNVSQELGQTARATLSLPLLGTAFGDTIGWAYRRGSGADPGYLRHDDGAGTTFDIRRWRLVRVTGGFAGEEYTLFTGLVDSIDPGTGAATVTCLGFEQFLNEQYQRVYPDRVSYMAFGYRAKPYGMGTIKPAEPVYGIQAYDNWPLEHAVRDLAARSGIDESKAFRALERTRPTGTASTVSYDGASFRTCWGRTMAGERLRLERPAHYGNAGLVFTETLPADDEYVFPPDATKEIWNRCRDLADRYGYDVRFGEDGELVLQPRNNPHHVENFVPSGGTYSTVTSPSAYGGTYALFSGAVPAHAVGFTASRIDLSFPRGPGLGTWAVTVRRTSDNAIVNGGPVTIDPSGTDTQYLYDFRTTVDGTNATVATLFTGPYDDYRVEISATGAGTRRLDCWLVYHTDPLTPQLVAPLSTGNMAFRVTGQDTMADMRNYVTVVGRRQATVTDSTKLETNPNNPDGEFVVARAVDVASITDPTALNYVGYAKEAVIYDGRVSDQDFAEYLARSFIYRYRNPQPGAQVEHAILPVMQLRDAIYAAEVGYGTVSPLTTLWVSGLDHRFDKSGATTTLRATGYPEMPSYDPRTDIDVDTYFGGSPAANVAVGYTSLDGRACENLAASGVVYGVDYASEGGYETGAISISAGTPRYMAAASPLPWPPAPGTLQVALTGGPTGTSETAQASGIAPPNLPYDAYGFKFAVADLIRCKSVTSFAVGASVWWSDNSTEWIDNVPSARMVRDDVHQQVEFYITGPIAFPKTVWKDGVASLITPHHATATGVVLYRRWPSGLDSQWKGNTPYHHLLDVDYRDAGRQVYLPWAHGDGLSAYTTPFSTITQARLRYRPLGPVDGSGNFDATLAYPSGKGPFYDPYTSEFGNLVSVRFDALVSGWYRVSVRNLGTREPAAWLTEPTAEAGDENKHWAYFQAGAGKLLLWDGVDNVGTWNRAQSAEYAAKASGAFEQEERPVIGAGFYAWNEERRPGGGAPAMALISGERDAVGVPVFGHGTYAGWFVRIECRSDQFADGQARTVSTDDVTRYPAFNPLSTASTAAIVYTHLGRPSRAELVLHDGSGNQFSDFTGDDYSETDATFKDDAYWGGPAADAVIHNARPVRLRFRVDDRPGSQWTAARNATQAVRLTKVVHLRFHWNDLNVLYKGTNWTDSEYEQREVYARRLANDAHTVMYTDPTWRRADTFRQASDDTATVEWVFRPEHFKANFTGVDNESLEFGNVLQLEDLPDWDPTHGAGNKRARHVLGFANYLFYLSAYTQDRSGRMVWCMDRRFLDLTKVCRNVASDWRNPANPAQAATSSTYRLPWPDDPDTQHRRTLLTRQWSEEPGWRAAQATRYGIVSGDLAWQYLQHRWECHDAAMDTINGVDYHSIQADNDTRSDQHYDSGELSWYWSAHNPDYKRQLGTWSSGHATTRIGASGPNPWTWEGEDDHACWIPCVPRDFHPFFKVPPGMDREGDRLYIYWQVDPSSKDDVAACEEWYGWTHDASGGDRFHLRTVADQGPKDNTSLDYSRRDDTVHWEQLRGVYTRREMDGQQPVKQECVSPYYVNQHYYWNVLARPSPNATSYPKFYAALSSSAGWFGFMFRQEYLWESPSLFPTDQWGRLLPVGVNARLGRYTDQTRGVYYDSGAWTGWKDDRQAPGETLEEQMADETNWAIHFTDHVSGSGGHIFDFKHQPVAVGPRLPVTTFVRFHMVLLNERRFAPLPV